VGERLTFFERLSHMKKAATDADYRTQSVIANTRALAENPGIRGRDILLHSMSIKAQKEISKGKLVHVHARIVGLAQLGFGDTESALEYFGMALANHPDPTDNDDFKGYVYDYTAASKKITELPVDQQKKSRESVIEVLKPLTETLPSIAHYINGEIGAHYAHLNQNFRAVPYLEKAVLGYSCQSADYQDYVDNYLRVVTGLSRVAGQSVGSKRSSALRDLVFVANSTKNVLAVHPHLEDVASAHDLDVALIRKYGGKQYASQFKNSAGASRTAEIMNNPEAAVEFVEERIREFLHIPDLVKREVELETALAGVNSFLQKSPKQKMEYTRLKGMCLEGLRRHEEALVAYDTALGMHPDSNQEDYQKYKESFMGAVGNIALLPPEKRPQARDRAIARLQSFMEKFPSDAYRYKNFIGFLYTVSDQPWVGLEYLGEAVLEHPDRTKGEPIGDFHKHVENYVTLVGSISTSAIERLDTPERDAALQDLFNLAVTLYRMRSAAPDIERIARETSEVLKWVDIQGGDKYSTRQVIALATAN